ncbi:hypothetical protein C8J57DRAFT_1633663 [Mycena rebaudengoi]|nr:hypothetical protein C8J57DRAFT_1633663 [Mycena rebaudengoi]
MPRTSESRNANALAIAFSVAATAIAVAATAAEFTPFPYIHQLSSLASSILNSIQAVKDNKAAFKRLATDAYELVHAVKNMADEGRTISFLLKRNLEDLVATLTAINDFALRHTSRGFFRRLISRSTDAAEIKEFQGRISQSLTVFELKTQIRTHENIVEMREELRLWSLERRDPPAAPDASPIAPPALPTPPAPSPTPAPLNPAPLPMPVPSPPASTTGGPSTGTPPSGMPPVDIPMPDSNNSSPVSRPRASGSHSTSYFGDYSTVSIGGNFKATTIHGDQINNSTYDSSAITDSYNLLRLPPIHSPPNYNSN